MDLPFRSNKLFLISGPCVVESEELCFEVAGKLKEVCTELDIPLVFKASYRKANRTSGKSFTGIGDKNALEILSKVRSTFDIPILTDIHESHEVADVAKVADVIQIPAFLCRQTDLLIAAGKTGKWVNIKKGQFMSAAAMQYSVEKVQSTGNQNILLTERGTTFGLEDLVVDFRGIPVMQSLGVPVVFDATHSLQKPNQSGGITGGNPEFIETMAKAAVAAGVNGLFIETHPNPSAALSDGANMLMLKNIKPLLEKLLSIHRIL